MVSDNIKQKKSLPHGPLSQYGRVMSIAEQKLWVWINKKKGQVINYWEGGKLQNWKIVCRKL